MTQMMNPFGKSSFDAPGAAGPGNPRAFEDFVSKLAERDRRNIERHLTECEGEPTYDRARLWKRLVGGLGNLAPFAVRTTGQRAVQFFIADGRYRRQVFALEDKADGVLSVYTGDSLDSAVQGGILRGPVSVDGEMMRFEVCEEPGQHLVAQSLTAARTTSAPDYYKHMLGWNRKAVRVILPTTASAGQVRAAEGIYGLAMEQVTG
jgi:hypothetical protein